MLTFGTDHLEFNPSASSELLEPHNRAILFSMTALILFAAAAGTKIVAADLGSLAMRDQGGLSGDRVTTMA